MPAPPVRPADSAWAKASRVALMAWSSWSRARQTVPCAVQLGREATVPPPSWAALAASVAERRAASSPRVPQSAGHPHQDPSRAAPARWQTDPVASGDAVRAPGSPAAMAAGAAFADRSPGRFQPRPVETSVQRPCVLCPVAGQLSLRFIKEPVHNLTRHNLPARIASLTANLGKFGIRDRTPEHGLNLLPEVPLGVIDRTTHIVRNALVALGIQRSARRIDPVFIRHRWTWRRRLCHAALIGNGEAWPCWSALIPWPVWIVLLMDLRQSALRSHVAPLRFHQETVHDVPRHRRASGIASNFANLGKFCVGDGATQYRLNLLPEIRLRLFH